MDDHKSVNHSKWKCKYQVVLIPKYRRKALYVEIERASGRCVPKAGGARGMQDRGSIHSRARYQGDIRAHQKNRKQEDEGKRVKQINLA
jgi:hypothetical protein